MTWKSKQLPLVWNESGRVPFRGHALSFFFPFFFLQTDRCQGNSLQNMRQHDSLDDCPVPADINKLLEDFGGKTGHGSAIIGRTLWISLFVSFVWMWFEGLMRTWGKHLWSHKAYIYLSSPSINVSHALHFTTTGVLVCDLTKWRWWKM